MMMLVNMTYLMMMLVKMIYWWIRTSPNAKTMQTWRRWWALPFILLVKPVGAEYDLRVHYECVESS